MLKNLKLLIVITFLGIGKSAAFFDGDYHIYTQQEAVERIFGQYTDLQLTEQSDPQSFGMLENAVSEVYQAMIDHLGVDPQDYPMPIVLAGEGLINGCHGHPKEHGHGHRASNLISVDSQLIEHPERLYGVLAHEMAHYFLGHMDGHHMASIHAYDFNYQEDDCFDCMPHNPNELALDEELSRLLSLALIVGENNLSRLQRHLPSDPTLQSFSTRFLLQLVSRNSGFDESCREATEVYLEILNDMVPQISTQTLQVDNGFRENMINIPRARRFQRLANQCFEKAELDFYQELENIFGVSKEDFLSHLLSTLPPNRVERIQRKIASAPLLESITELQTVIQGYLNRRVNRQKLQNLATTKEDVADTVALRALHQARLPVRGLENHLLLGVMNPEDAQNCLDQLALGLVPPYGRSYDIHHGQCWRVYRSRALIRELQ